MMSHRLTPHSTYKDRRHSTLIGIMLMLGVGCSPCAYSATVAARSFDELAQRAELIIVGTVREVRSEFGNGGLDLDNIISTITFTDLEIVKGDASSPDYELQVPGGVVGRVAQSYPGIPLFLPGRRYVLFIRGNRRDFFPIVGITQGVFRVLADSQGRQVVMRDDVAAQAGRYSSLRSATDGAPSLDNFLKQIRERLPLTEGQTP